MAEHSVTNLRYAYITNAEYRYPPSNQTQGSDVINTGWQVIPNQLWTHLLSPKQWLEFKTNYEAFHLKSMKAVVFNMIPLTETLAIQQNVTFAAFNNTIYAMAYTDDLYETNPYDWDGSIYNYNLVYKEGARNDAGTKAAINLPEYVWYRPPNTANYNYSGILWDPLNRPKHIMELRPGKNAISFHWNSHECDKDTWFNTDTFSYTASTPPDGTDNNPDQFPRGRNLKVTLPSTWDAKLDHVSTPWWFNVFTWKNNYSNLVHGNTPTTDGINRKVLATNTESNQTKYPPTQWFIKLIPLYDANNALINTRAQIAIMTTVTFGVKRRRSALYAPSYMPFANSAREVYSINMDIQQYRMNEIRARSGGKLRADADHYDPFVAARVDTDMIEHLQRYKTNI